MCETLMHKNNNKGIQKFIWVCFLGLLVFYSHISSAAIGLPENTIRYGLASNMGLYHVDDPQGESQKKFFVQPYNLLVTDWLPNAWRYNAEFYYASMLFKAESNKIGQTVEQYGSRLLLMYNVNTLKVWQPWFGLGMDFSYAQFSQRHSVDDEGFLTGQFDDRKTLNAAWVFQMATEWQLDRRWDAGLKVQYALPLNHSIQSLSLGLYLLYRGF